MMQSYSILNGYIASYRVCLATVEPLYKGHHLSNEDTVCSETQSCVQSTSELGTPLYSGQPVAGS